MKPLNLNRVILYYSGCVMTSKSVYNWIPFLILFFISIPCPLPAEVQEQVPVPPRVLTLTECLDLGMQNNISLMRVRIGLEASYIDHVRNEAMFDPGFEMDFSGRGSDSMDSASSVSSTNQLDLGMRYLLPTWQGSNWVVSFDQSRASGSYAGQSATDYTAYTSQFGVAYSLPLLEGYGERINRIGLERSDLGIRRSEASVSDVERNLRLGIIQAYVQAMLAKKQIEVVRLSLDTAENLVEEVQARIDVGQFAQYELLAAKSGLAERQEALLNTQSGYATLLDSLKELIGLPITDEIEIDTGILQPVYIDTLDETLYFDAQRNRPDLADIDFRIQQAQLDLLLVTDRRQSSLTWKTILGLAGQGEGYSDSLSDLEHFSWYTGLEYRIPLGGNRIAEADISSAQLALDQLELERVDFLRNLQRDIRSALENFRNALLRIDVTAQGLEVQEVKMESEQLRLEMGLITSRDLLEFDLDLANARLAHDQALADTLQALARLESIVNMPLLDDALVISDVLTGTGGSE